MTDSTPPSPLTDVLVERVLDHTREDENGPVTVRVYKPVQRAPDRWECMLEFKHEADPGPPHRQVHPGEDSAHALFHALGVAEGMAGRRYNPTPPDIFVERILDYAVGVTFDTARERACRFVEPVPCARDLRALLVGEDHEIGGEQRVRLLDLLGCLLRSELELRRVDACRDHDAPSPQM